MSEWKDHENDNKVVNVGATNQYEELVSRLRDEDFRQICHEAADVIVSLLNRLDVLDYKLRFNSKD